MKKYRDKREYYRAYYKKNKDKYRERYYKNRDKILKRMREEKFSKIGTTDFGAHPNPDPKKEQQIIETEFKKLRLWRWKKAVDSGVKY